MTEPLYDPFARFEDAKIRSATDLVNHSVDYYRTTIVEFLNNIILDCEANGRDSVPVEALRVIASYVAELPLPIVTETDDAGADLTQKIVPTRRPESA